MRRVTHARLGASMEHKHRKRMLLACGTLVLVARAW